MSAIDDYCSTHDLQGVLKATGYDSAIIGITTQEPFRVIYETNKILEILVERDGMNMDEASEFFYFNIKGSYMGENAPIFIEES